MLRTPTPRPRVALEFRFWLGLASMFVISTGLVLVAMVAVSRMALGLDATVVMTGSMQPSIRPGDVVVLQPRVDRPGAGTVIRFRDPGRGTLVHRISEVRPDGIVTRGDSNPSADSGVRTRADVLGVGVAVVPLVGQPVVWWSERNWAALAALVVVVAVAWWSVGSGALAVDPWAASRPVDASAQGPFTARTLTSGDSVPAGLVPDAVGAALVAAGVSLTGVALGVP